MAHYAWAPIRFSSKVDKDSGAVLETSTVEVGDSVDAGKLGVDEAEWDALVESGVVREEKYPEAAKEQNLPPQQVMVEEANAALLAAEAGQSAMSEEKEEKVSGKAASASKS